VNNFLQDEMLKDKSAFVTGSYLIQFFDYEYTVECSTELNACEFASTFFKKIEEVIKGIFNNKAIVRYNVNPRIGFFVLIIADISAKEALNKWIEVIKRLQMEKISVPVFVDWLRETDVTPEELGAYVGQALALMDLELVTETPIDVEKIVRELRE